MTLARTTLACISGHAEWLGKWCVRHRRWLAVTLVLAAGALLTGSDAWALGWFLIGLGPGLLGAVWRAALPVGYERLAAGPAHRLGWWWLCRRRWEPLAESCGLTGHVPVTVRRDGRRVTEHRTITPRLRRVRVHGSVVALTIRAAPGRQSTTSKRPLPGWPPRWQRSPTGSVR